MDNAKIWFTKDGYDKLGQELQDLRTKREPTLLRLQAAREQGDLSENGAYKAARFELSDIDRNIRRLTYLLKAGEVKAPRNDGIIGFGSLVALERGGQKFTYQLVSKYESDPGQNKLSDESPLGQKLMGKRAGEDVTVTAPAGEMYYKIIKVA